jgi:AraC-like DNA-binding protein
MGRVLQERVTEIVNLDEKVLFVEKFLYKQLVTLQKSDPITDYAINQINLSNGLISINELSEEMGYSRRYLLNKFMENVGLSPKEFACIVRFSSVFKGINLHDNEEKHFELYYDQSHLIKEFKKYTGLTPGGGEDLNRILAQVNDNGGSVLMHKTFLSDMAGHIAIFMDTEGNRIGVQSMN